MTTNTEPELHSPQSQENKQKEATLKFSILEGSSSGISLAYGDNYVIPFALAINATAPQIGLMNALVGILSPTAQMIGSRLMEKRTRKQVLVGGVVIQMLMWIPFLLVAFSYINNTGISNLPIAVIIIYVGYIMGGGIASPAWFSLMGDIVPDNMRGRYFSKRNMINNAVALVGTLSVSFVLDYYQAQNYVVAGFICIFIIGLITRGIALFLLTKHYYPPFPMHHDRSIRLIQFIKEIPKDNFGRFTIFVTLINFAQMIAGPFFSVYMLKNLNFTYTELIIVNLSQSLVALCLYPIVGKFGDKYGNIKMLRVGSMIIPILPLLWLFLNTPMSIILGPQLLGGIGWTAFNLAASNFIYDSIPSAKRGYYVAYYNFLIGFGILTGGLIGSIFIGMETIGIFTDYQFVFFLSGMGRIVIVVFFIPLIKEIRSVESRVNPPGRVMPQFRHMNIQKFFWGIFTPQHNNKNHEHGRHHLFGIHHHHDPFEPHRHDHTNEHQHS